MILVCLETDKPVFFLFYNIVKRDAIGGCIMLRQESEALFQKYEFWDKLTEVEKRLLEQQIKLNDYEEGQFVTGTGSECLGLFLVKEGTLRIYLMSDDGKEATVCRVHEGEFCILSGSCLLSNISFDVHMDAETKASVYMIPAGALKRIMKDNIYLENFIYKSMNEGFSDIISAFQKMLFASLEQRLVSFLLDESVRKRNNKIMMTQEQIAKSIGSAREAVSRILKQLSQEDCVELFRGGVQVKDRKKLYEKI